MAKTAHAFNEENIKYLRALLGDEKVDTFLAIGDQPDERVSSQARATCEQVAKCLEHMEKFENNRWWTSEDKRVLGYYQLMNPLLLVPFDKFREALETLLGRPVWTHEMALGPSYEGLKAEAERAFKGEQKAQARMNSFEQLAGLGKPVAVVVE